MRVYFAEVKTRYQAIKECPFTPSNVAKVYGASCVLSLRMTTIHGKTKSNQLSRIGLTYTYARTFCKHIVL